MLKKIDSVCDNCSSQFELKFNEDLVKDNEEIYCPFCKMKIEEINEELLDEYSYVEYVQEDMWD